MRTPPPSPRNDASSPVHFPKMTTEENQSSTQIEGIPNQPPPETRFVPRQITLFTMLAEETFQNVLSYMDRRSLGRLAITSFDLSERVANTDQHQREKMIAGAKYFKNIPFRMRFPQALGNPRYGLLPAEWKPKIDELIERASAKQEGGTVYLSYLCSNEVVDLLLHLRLSGQEPDLDAYLRVPAALIPRTDTTVDPGYVSAENDELVKRGIMGVIQGYCVSSLGEKDKEDALKNMLVSKLFFIPRFKRPLWFYGLRFVNHQEPACRLSIEQMRKITSVWPKELNRSDPTSFQHPLEETAQHVLILGYDSVLINIMLDAGIRDGIHDALRLAIRYKNVPVFNTLLSAASIADIEHIPENHYKGEGAVLPPTLLALAVESKLPDFVAALLQKGQHTHTLDRRMQNGDTPLTMAVEFTLSRDESEKQAGIQMVQLLVGAGAEIERLHLIHASNAEVLKILLRGKGAQEAVVQLDKNGDSALSYQLAGGAGVEIAQLLLEAGADKVINSVSRYTGTPLLSAVNRGNIALFRLLMQHGATPCGNDPEVKNAWPMLTALNNQSAYTRHLSAEDRLEMARTILDHPPYNDPAWWRDPKYHQPTDPSITHLPFEKSYAGAAAVAEQMLERGADFGINWAHKTGNTPLHQAVQHAIEGYDNGELMRLLLKKGAWASVMHFNQRSQRFHPVRLDLVPKTPVHFAIESKRSDLLVSLLPYCAPAAITHEPQKGTSLLKAAIKTGDFAIVKMLVDRVGPHCLTQPDAAGMNALQWATVSGFRELSMQLKSLLH